MVVNPVSYKKLRDLAIGYDYISNVDSDGETTLAKGINSLFKTSHQLHELLMRRSK